MKNLKILWFVFLAVMAFGVVRADENSNQKRRGRPAASRQRGTPMGHNRIITHKDGHEFTRAVVSDSRPLAKIHKDKTLVRVKLGFYPPGHVANRWDHWHRDWGVYWRFADWGRINQVTCEAVNTTNNYLYPVTGYRTDFPSGWSNDVANQLVENALDNCYAESEQIGADPNSCVLIDWECRYLL